MEESISPCRIKDVKRVFSRDDLIRSIAQEVMELITIAQRTIQINRGPINGIRRVSFKSHHGFGKVGKLNHFGIFSVGCRAHEIPTEIRHCSGQVSIEHSEFKRPFLIIIN